jgi:2-polyprenyl-6-methoxyphenol hydroxylase-like FAD-dependent oxidoreductase
MRIAIIGCGPAGLSAAIALHDNQFDVTLFDQFDTPGPVGSGLMLQPTGLAVLEAPGLRDQAEQLGQRIDGMLGKLATNGKTVLDIRYKALDESLYGVAIHRASLFQILFDAVNARGIPVVTGQTITSVTQTDIFATPVSDTQPATQPTNKYDAVIDASGANSSILRNTFPALKRKALSFGALWTTLPLAGFSTDILEQRYVRAHKMIGVLPCGTLPEQSQALATFFYSIEACDFEQWQQQGITRWKQQVIQMWPQCESLLTAIDTTQQLTYTSYNHHTLKHPANGRVFFIGDTAHATSPQLGQGANMAFLDAIALANALNRHRNNMAAAGNYYAKLRRRHVRLYQSISYLLTPFYQSNSTALPLLRDTMFEPVTAIGPANRLITLLGAGMLANPSAQLTESYLNYHRNTASG